MKGSEDLKPPKWVKQALILSASLNGIFILIFFIFIIKDRPVTSNFEYKPINSSLFSRYSEPVLNIQVIHTFQAMSYEQLVEKLKDKQLAEDGYMNRDIALACLVNEHYFDLKKALNGKMAQEREIFFSSGMDKKSIILFAGLQDRDYELMLHFLQKEKWPFTSQGLFNALKRHFFEESGQLKDSSLIHAFCETPEFLAVETLFGRSGVPILKRTLLSLICEGSWDSLSQFARGQKDTQDFSPARRQCFLVDYVGQKSKTAAYLLILTDRLYAEKRLEDSQVCALLNLLNEQTTEAQLFAKELLAGPRSDAVHQMAMKKLYEYSGETLPERLDRKEALAKFCKDDLVRAQQYAKERASQKIANQELLDKLPQQFAFSKTEVPAEKPVAKSVGVGTLRPKFRDRPPASPSPRSHVVQDGESLWMISRKYSVSLNALMEYNHLSSNLIKPGKVLKIPPTINP